MDLSEDDRALINVLQLAPRISWQDAGYVLGRHPTTLAAHWERLRTAGLAWVTAHLLGDPAHMTLSFVEIDCELRRRDEVEAALCAIPEVLSVEESASNRDLVLTVTTPSWADLTGRVLPQIARIPGIVKYRSAMCTAMHATADRWNLEALSAPQRARLRTLVSPSASSYAGPPPSSYWPIVQVLSRNGRATAMEIAEATGLHPVTARRQLNRVLGGGTLLFRCDVAQNYSGYPVSCQWFASLPPEERDSAVAVLRGFRSLRLCASTTGTSNFTFVMWMRSAAEVLGIEDQFLAAVPRARIIESSLTVKFPKRVGVMLNPDTTATGEVVVPALPR
ncbi:MULTISPECIES: Lrp/AsnC family transcriptional regulator [Paeniglutamicibacter]|uniref:DNA-binding Lrp family transcriptional regulator n=1 Tax=Paeniglutamicibacter sulfureus TaxID=43666 RepID=A0ABU2BMW3_9MICC|nr:MULTISPECIES: Lrp/AsnC family transcriptional regulator [Paeniglutamicibacter]MCV9996433.1 Lrp/AsnC family transcriptional regulator [Paeniglutamicibacter sp. ZC-3]MDO2935618.1 Lrp/AsnC family transcriptional regulator [Paeniglutamicibacter sulfureus]MDR7359987.1 DNA-binding Lrp family transcriptional regulator [Paeniglutamicibacter sulfureus]